MVLGQLKIKDFLQRTLGHVRGTLVSDAKRRWYAADYQSGDIPQRSMASVKGNAALPDPPSQSTMVLYVWIIPCRRHNT